ncbi:hypothetical protein E2320_001097 [Naja naja]|nr:hypothetical protein E2320_001097 [Naja naja]
MVAENSSPECPNCQYILLAALINFIRLADVHIYYFHLLPIGSQRIVYRLMKYSKKKFVKSRLYGKFNSIFPPPHFYQNPLQAKRLQEYVFCNEEVNKLCNHGQTGCCSGKVPKTIPSVGLGKHLHTHTKTTVKIDSLQPHICFLSSHFKRKMKLKNKRISELVREFGVGFELTGFYKT